MMWYWIVLIALGSMYIGIHIGHWFASKLYKKRI